MEKEIIQHFSDWPKDSVVNIVVNDYINNNTFEDNSLSYLLEIAIYAYLSSLKDIDEKEIAAIIKYFPDEKDFINIYTPPDIMSKFLFLTNNVSYTKEETDIILSSLKERILNNSKYAEKEVKKLYEDSEKFFDDMIKDLDEIAEKNKNKY